MVRKIFNKKARSTFVCVFIMICIIITTGNVIHDLVGRIKYHMNAYALTSFWDIHDDLTYIVDDFQDIYVKASEYNTDLNCIYVYYFATDGQIQINYVFPDKTKNYYEQIVLSEKQQSALLNIWRAFHGHDYGSLGHISVTEKQVAFHRVGDYALVFSENGLSPSYIVHDHVNDIYVKRISLKWFHCLNVANPEA